MTFKSTEDPAAFFSMVGPDGCWEWNGGRDKDGYGQTRIGMKRVKAHRKAWEILYGPIPEGMHILHRCDNPPCVRPNHLFIGTNTENRRDAASKGRIPKPTHLKKTGEANPRAKLTGTQVAEIRARYATGTVTQQALAEEFGIAQTGISGIVRNKTWR